MASFDELKKMLDQAPCGIGLFDYEGNGATSYLNKTYYQLIGYTQEEYAALHRSPMEVLVYPEDLPIILAQKMEMQKTGHGESEYRIIRKDGTLRWIRQSASEVTVNGQVLEFNTFVDVTKERSRYRLALEQTKATHECTLRAMGVIMDIHDEMEKFLMMNELVGTLPSCVGIFKFNPEMQCLYLNQGPFKAGGRSDEQVRAIFDDPDMIQRLIFASDQELYRTEVLQKTTVGERINCDFRYYKSVFSDNNGIGWIHLSAVKICEEDNCPVYYAILAEPSDESKIFKQISEHSPVAELAVEYPSGKILYANRAFCKLDHLPVDATIIGCDFSTVLSATDVTVLKQFIQDSHAKAFAEMETWTSCGKYFKIQAHPLNWNGKVALMLYLSDQTEAKQFNDRLVKIINSVPSGIGIYELRNGNLFQLYLNDAFHRMLHDTRQNREKYTGDRYLGAIHPDDVPDCREKIARVVNGVDTIQTTYRIKDGKGNWRWFRVDGNLEVGTDNRKFFYCSFFDVDEQVKTRLQLQREQATLKLAMQAGKISSWIYEVEDGHVYEAGGSSLRQICGEKLEDISQTLREGAFVHPDSRKEYRELFRDAVYAGNVKQADLRVKMTGSPDYCWKHVVITPIFDEYGKHIRSIGTVVDVTERKNNEQKYHHKIQELSMVNSSDLIAKGFYNLTRNRVESYHPNTNNAVPVSNAASYDDGFEGTAKRFFKESEEENFRRLFDRQQLLDNYASGEMEVTIEYQRKAEDGTIFWARTQSKLTVEPNSKDILCFIYTYDINAHKIAQETINTVIYLDYDYFVVLDCHTNSYALYSSGDADSEPLMPPQRSLDYEKVLREYAGKYVVPEEVEHNIHSMSIDSIRDQLQTKESFTSYVGVRKNDGKLRRKKMQFSYLDRENQQVLITCMDITNIYEQEQQRLVELQETAQALQRANRIKTNFLARMSHDLRTPMNAVIGLTALARDEINDPVAIEHYLTSIASAGNFLLELVNDCLDLEKISENKMSLHPTIYPYATFRQNIRSIINPLCEEKNIVFVLPEKRQPYTPIVDGVRLEQIIINLLTNAVKFTPEGGKVELLVTSTCSMPNTLSSTFIVRDNGIGMSQKFQQRMFEPFAQEDNTAMSQSQGTGLGLAIIKNLVELMNGSIFVKSKKGWGTEFTVCLDMPLADGANHIEREKRSAVSSALKNKCILLVEDHPLNTEIARKLLEKKDVCVTHADNGRVALELFRQSELFAFDAILMDIRMPVMNGLDAACAIRTLDRDDARKIPIIAMTANAFEEDVQATKQAGMNAHLSKPIQPNRLYEVLENLIAHSIKKM